MVEMFVVNSNMVIISIFQKTQRFSGCLILREYIN
jgi:hypothetical protein